MAAIVAADPFPPYWDGGSGAAVHHAPVAWPQTNDWQPYTKLSSDIEDRANSDESNGGTSPQSYVNVSSGCTDQTLPSVYYAFDAGSQVLFFRWRVQAPPHNYATGPNPGTYGATSPWNSALWTVFIDTNGDGYRDFAVHLDGSSGGPSTAVDRISAIWSNTKSQSLDYVNDPDIHLIGHNPTAFVDGPSASNRILNFHGSLSPDALWPNGAAETEWDYGTTRATKLNTGCGEYFIDYQIPLAMLDATAVGGPAVTPTTPMSLFFATANSLNNPLQKDVVVTGDFLADPSRPVPGGDTITPAGGAFAAPIVSAVSALGCGPAVLSATVLDTLNDDGSPSVASVQFLAYADTNGDGLANDGSQWVAAGAAAANPTVAGQWLVTWDSSTLARGRYLIGVLAADQQGHTTYSYLDQAAVNADHGTTPPHFANLPGLVFATLTNTCGAAPPSIAVAVSPTSVTAGQPVTITVTITNTLASALSVSAISDVLPAGFTYHSTTGGTLSPDTTPTPGDGGAIGWTFSSASIPASSTGTLIFAANASSVAGAYSTTAGAVSSAGSLASTPAEIGVGAAALAIYKVPSTSSAAPGDPITYTIAYQNPATVAVTNVAISDVLPEGLDFVSATDGGSYHVGSRTVTWTIGSLSPGATGSVQLATTVTAPYPASALVPLVNTASITSTETGSTGHAASVFIEAPRARLSVQLEAASSLAPVNTAVPYTVTVANIGNADAVTTLTLPIPTGWSFVSATNGGSHVSGTVTWSLGTLAANSGTSVGVTLTSGPAYAGSNLVTKTATASATGVTPASDTFTIGLTGMGSVCSTYYFRTTTTNVGFDGVGSIANTTAVTASDAGTSVTAVSPDGDTEVELASFYQDPATVADVEFDGTLSSTMWVSRSGGAPAILNGYVYDYDPVTGTRVALGSGSGTFNGNSLTQFSFDVALNGTLAAGHRILWRYALISQNNNSQSDITLLYGGTVSGTVRSSSSQFCVDPPASPAVDIQVSALEASAGDPLTYTVQFGNSGDMAMTTPELTVWLPDGVTFTSATLNGSPITPSSGGQAHEFAVESSGGGGGIAGGGSGTLVISAEVGAPFTGASPTLTASASLDSDQTTGVGDLTTTALIAPSVTIAKLASHAMAHAGVWVSYSLGVLNGGPGTATDVTVTDVLPVTAYYTYVPGSARLNNVPIGNPIVGNTLAYNLGTLAAGSSATLTFQMAVSASGLPAGVTAIDNTATVSDATTPGTRTSNTVTTLLSSSPNLELTKDSAPSSGPLSPGDSIVYTLTVTNAGTADATSVVVTDPVPTGTTYDSGTLGVGGSPLSDVLDADAGWFDGSGNRVVFAVGTLAAGESRVYTYSVSLPATMSSGSTSIGSTATATAGNAATRTASHSIAVSADPVLTLTKAGPASVAFPAARLTAAASAATVLSVDSTASLRIGDVVRVGGTTGTVLGLDDASVTLDTAITAAGGAGIEPSIEYVLTYTNSGNANATNVEVADPLPAGATFVTASPAGSLAAGTITWTVGMVPAGASGALRVRVLPAPGVATNVAQLTGDGIAPVSSNTVVTSVGALVVGKTTSTPSPATSGANTTATYAITLVNQSPTTAADDVTIGDVLPAGFSYLQTISLSGATALTSPAVGDTRPTWTGLSIPAASTATLVFEAAINNVAAGTFQNEVEVTSSTMAVRGFDALATTVEDVTVSGVLGTTGVPAITSSILAGTALTVAVTDADLDADPTSAETVIVTVQNPRTGETEAVTLTETGVATGVFTGTLATVQSWTAGASASAPLNVAGGDTPFVAYEDAFTGTGSPATVSAASSVSSNGNTAPTAADDSWTAQRNDAAAAIVVLGNDTTAPDTGETLTIAAVTQGTNGGVVVITGGGTGLTYQPAANAFGTETFTYTVSDGNGGSGTASVTVLVNRPPTAAPDTHSVAEDASLSLIDVLANDTFAPDAGEYLFIYDTSPGSNGGTLDVVGCGTMIEYTPAPGFTGTETFTYTIRDGNGGEATATVTVTVGDPNSQPTAADDTASIAKNAAATAIDVLANDSAAPDTGETLTISAVTQGSNGGVVAITGGGTGLTFQPAPDYVGTETFTYTIGDGNGGTDTATVTMTVGPVYRRYFSEGVNNTAMATFVSLANPALVARPVHVEFYRQSGPPIAHDLTLAPRSRTTIDTRTIAGLANAAFATAIEADATVVAERTLTWNFGEPGSSLEHAVEASTSWYFAEGSTTGRFSLFYLLSNPNLTPATVTIDFLPQAGPPVQRVYTIAPRTRLTVPVNTVTASLASADLGAAVTSDLPIVVERSMFLSTPTQTWVAGTTGAGVTQPLTQWFFGEGNVGPFFDAWILLANPTTTPATAQVRYLSENGQETITTHTVPVGRRITIRVAADAPNLYASSFGVVVTSTNGVPIVAERAMWWPNDGRGWYEGHVATGLPTTAPAWGVADGVVSADGDTEDYVLIANTSAVGGVVKVTTVLGDGVAPIERLITIGPAVRVTLRMRTFQPEVVGQRFSVFVEAQGANPVALAVEHSSYTNTSYFWGAGSSAPASPIQ